MYLATDVADFVIQYSSKKKYEMSYTRLQLFLYFIQKDYALGGSKCFSDKIEQGKYGPSIPAVCEKYRTYADAALPVPEIVPEIDNEDQLEIQAVINKYALFSTEFLQMLAKDGSPTGSQQQMSRCL